MTNRTRLLEQLGGELGCRRLSTEFYARVGKDPVLRPLFPGKSLKCAIEEFAAFLIQFLGGDEAQTQRRWWLSLRESHARFRIGPTERRAWLKNMAATLDASPFQEATRTALRQFFEHSSAYLISSEQAGPLEHGELAQRWAGQRDLDAAIAAIAAGSDPAALALAPSFRVRPAVFIGLLARMVESGRAALIGFVVEELGRDPSLAALRSGGRSLMHYASGAGCLAVITTLLRQGADPDILDSGGHTPLYRVANQCQSDRGPEIVRALVRAGAGVNAGGGVTRATPLHMAARRGFSGIAGALLDCGAAIDARDRKGETPLQRAVNCRQDKVAQLLLDRGAAGKHS
ncbi:MAG: ankyrin repeat domain-containing protein [Acidobacteria bacterium]|nr:ankyrin repeat domain-containing protein [Acidobacteriota bacterium]